MASIEDYGIRHQPTDKMLRSGVGVERRQGWYVYSEATGKDINKYRAHETEEAAIAARAAIVEEKTTETPAKPTVAPVRIDSGYRTKSSAYGEGRVYHDQPGATQYDDGSGTYKIQIWDES